MDYLNLGNTDVKLSRLGFGTWQFANSSGSWVGSSKEESQKTLAIALESGLNFIDTAQVYGDGLAEKWIGEVVNDFGREKVVIASKIFTIGGWKEPNINSKIKDFYPEEWIYKTVDETLKNLNSDYVDLMQFHVWNDSFAVNDNWKKVTRKLRESGKVRNWGISLLGQDFEDFRSTVETGLIQSVQMVFNLFHQVPIQETFGYLKEKSVSVLARVPLDEGGLTGSLVADMVFEDGDFRAGYFQGDRLNETISKVELLKILAAKYGIYDIVELALRFAISFDVVTSVIPGMRKLKNLESNLAIIEKGPLPAELILELQNHSWKRDFYQGAWG